MGFPGFPAVTAGFFPIVVLNTAISMTAFKDILRSVLQVVGLSRDLDGSGRDSLRPYPLEDRGLSSGLVLPSISEEIKAVLPVVSYDSGFEDSWSEEDAQCSVCLLDFERGEEIRQLPFCSHIFHKSCLDRWLDRQQTTCPLCRSSLVPEEVAREHRRREQELTEELILWFSSFHGVGFQGLWWQT